jgi:hypothetical protein
VQCLEQALAVSAVRKVALAPLVVLVPAVAPVEVAELALAWEMVVERQVLSEVLAQGMVEAKPPGERTYPSVHHKKSKNESKTCVFNLV